MMIPDPSRQRPLAERARAAGSPPSGSGSAPSPSRSSDVAPREKQRAHSRQALRVGRLQQVETVRRIEIARRTPGLIRVPVLPDDVVRLDADDDDAVAEVVVDRDQAGRDQRRERRMVERSRSRGRPVTPEHAAGPGHDDRVARLRVVREQDPAWPEQLRIGRVRHRRLHRPAQPAVRADVVDPRAVDLAHERAAVGKRRGAVDRAELGRRVVPAHTRRAVLAHDLVRVVDEENAAVVRVGNGDESVRQQVRVVGRAQVAGARALLIDVAVAPQDLRARERDDLNRVLVFLVRDDPVDLAARRRCRRRTGTAWQALLPAPETSRRCAWSC